jgi:hypothetical protein
MLVFRSLNPEARVREKVRAVQVVPVDVRDDDVAHVFRPDAEARQGSRGALIRRRPPASKELVAVETGIHEHVPSARQSGEPYHQRDVRAATRVGTRHERGDGKRSSVPYRTA